MPDRSAIKRIGIFGGTFDPVHYGHLRMARELRATLALDEMRLMPAGQPPHRRPPRESAAHRWRMVQLAAEEFTDLSPDDSEIRRAGPSYSVLSIEALRAELGAGVKLALCMGWDSLVSLPTWHRWTELLAQCAIVAVNRPHHTEATAGLPPALQAALADSKQTADLQPGRILVLEVTPQPMSATALRELADSGRPWPPDWVPPAVISYIKQHGLYGLR